MFPSEIRANFNLDIVVADKATLVPVGYTPKLILGGATSTIISGAIGSGNINFSLVPDDTETLTTGEYWYQVIAELDVDHRVFIQDGLVFIQGVITGSGAYDGRSVAEKILQAIDAAMLGKATTDQQSYTIQSGAGSRSLSRLSLAELKDVREYYAQIVAAERRNLNDEPLFKRHKFAFVADYLDKDLRRRWR